MMKIPFDFGIAFSRALVGYLVDGWRLELCIGGRIQKFSRYLHSGMGSPQKRF